MPLRIRIGNPLDLKTLGKNLRILPDGTVATSTGQPIGDPNLPTERVEQASLVDIGGRTGLKLSSEKGFDLTTEPADRTNTYLVLHAPNDSPADMVKKLSTTGLEIRRGTTGATVLGSVEALIPAYPFCQGYDSADRVPNPNVIPSSFKSRVLLDYLLINDATYMDATFLSRLSMPESFLVDDGQLDELTGIWDEFDPESTPPALSENAPHPVRMLPLVRPKYRFFNHPYYAGLAGSSVTDPTSLLYANVEKVCSYTIAWGVYDGSERPINPYPVEEVLHMGGSPHFLMTFRCIPGGEPIAWNVHWIDGGSHIARYMGLSLESSDTVPDYVRDYPIWPQASLTDGESDNDNGAFFWGNAPSFGVNTKRELSLTPEEGVHDQFTQVSIAMSVSAFVGGEAET